MKRLALLLTIILVSLVGMLGVSWAAGPSDQSIIVILQSMQQRLAALEKAVQPKRYFITADINITATAAPNACGPGFHMASLFEILDPSNMAYDNTNDLAFKQTDHDLGAGPPSTYHGWVHTGYYNSHGLTDDGFLLPLGANCDGWSSDDTYDADGNYRWGTAVALMFTWKYVVLPGDSERLRRAVPWWDADRRVCSGSRPVWCVSD